MGAMFSSSNNPVIVFPRRLTRSGSSKESKGVQVRTFKAPTLSANTHAAKVDVDYRPMSRTGSKPDSAPMQAVYPRSDTTKLIVASSKEVCDRRSCDCKTSGSSRQYAIYPTAVPDTYIYERSVSSRSDYYSASSDIASEDEDSIDDPAYSPLFSHDSVSSASSTDALSGNALLEYPMKHAVGDSHPSSRSPSPPQWNSASNAYPRVRSLTPIDASEYGANPSGNGPSRPLPTPPVPFSYSQDGVVPAGERVVLSDGTTYVRPRLPSLGLGERPQGLMPAQRRPSPPAGRGVEERAPIPPPSSRRNSPDVAFSVTSQNGQAQGPRGNVSFGVLPPPAGLGNVDLPRDIPALSASPEPYQNGFADPRGAAVPHRRNSDVDQSRVLLRRPVRSNTAPPNRSVRWNDNLICPSPIPTCQRRKGWFNRRGDQLWNNDGGYKPAPPGQEFPLDLDGYPEEGWQNEEGVRIDVRHRLVPKAPLRSALKRSKPQEQVAGYITFSDIPTNYA